MAPLEVLALYIGTLCGAGLVTLGAVWIWEKRF